MPKPKLHLLLLLLCFATGCTSKDESLFGVPSSSSESLNGVTPDVIGIVKAAIDAHGAHSLDEIKAGRLTLFIRGHVTSDIKDEITMVSTFQIPDQLRVSTEHVVKPNKWKSLYVRNGHRAWQQDGDDAYRPSADLRRIEDLHPFRLIHDLYFLLDDSVSLRYGGERPVGARILMVIHASSEGQHLFDVFFDQTTHLIAGISSTAYDPRTQRAVKSETNYSDYRRFCRLVLPTTMTETLDGSLFVEKSLQDFTIMERAAPEDFIVVE